CFGLLGAGVWTFLPVAAPLAAPQVAVAAAAPRTAPVAIHSEEAEQGGWGTIKGQIAWGGDALPEPKPVNVDKDQQHCLSKGPIHSEDWVVNPKNKGVKWTFVWLDVEPLSGQTLPIHPDVQQLKQKKVTIDQPCCAFVPHCLAMREGQTLEVKNSAQIP